MGLIGLFAVAAAIWIAGGVWVLLRKAKHPPAGVAGAAVAAGEPLDPTEAGLSWERWVLRTSDGLDLPVWDISGEGEDDVVVLVHDWGAAPLSMLQRAGALMPTVKRILIPCLRGHDGASGACSLGPREADDLGRLLETIDEDRVRLEGVGLGGWIVEHVRDAPTAAHVTSANPWIDQPDGLRRILRASGFPAFPIATVAGWWRRLCRRSAGEQANS
jgi:pimeloyl-ACP methyl ester carboxylesterase